MDELFGPLVGLTALAAAGAILLAFFLLRGGERSRLKRLLGERLVRRELDRLGYEALHDVSLPYRGDKVRVDHIVKVGGAVVVIAAENFSGMIFGSRDGIRWKQVMPGGRHEYSFENPIYRNEAPLKAVQALVSGDVRSLLAYAGSAEFAEVRRPSGVVSLRELADVLREIERSVPASIMSRRNWSQLLDQSEGGARVTAREENGAGIVQGIGRRLHLSAADRRKLVFAVGGIVLLASLGMSVPSLVREGSKVIAGYVSEIQVAFGTLGPSYDVAKSKIDLVNKDARCRGFVKEFTRLAEEDPAKISTYNLYSALVQRARETKCITATDVEVYPSGGLVRGYLNRLRDESRCAGFAEEFRRIGAKEESAATAVSIGATWVQVQMNNCARG